MKTLVIYAHPAEDSLNAEILSRLSGCIAPEDLRVRKLCVEEFDPLINLQRYRVFNDIPENRAGVEDHVADVEWAEALIFIYPTWWYGLPAILKGWLERVLIPGVAMKIDAAGKPAGPLLSHIRLFGAIATYGAPWWWTRFVGDPGRRTLMRGVRWLSFTSCRTFWIAHYDIHRRSQKSIGAGLDRMEAKLRRIFGTSGKETRS